MSGKTAEDTFINLMILISFIYCTACITVFTSIFYIGLYKISYFPLKFVLIYLNLLIVVLSVALYKIINYINSILCNYRSLKYEAERDYLTGLYNMRFFYSSFEALILKLRKKEGNFSIILVDTDNFKAVNDIYGHSSGDYVLKELSKILLFNCRKSDIVCRIGGDEFSILLPSCDYCSAMEVAERIRRSVEENKFTISKEGYIQLTVSVGVVDCTESINEDYSLFDQVDSCLYKAKQCGRNTVCSVRS